MAKQLFTIGYSGYKDIEDFISELKEHEIQILIDVRSSPYSAYYEQYNKEQLSRKLKENDIFYSNYARQFGARQDNPSFYRNGESGKRLDFELFSKSDQFLEGVHAVEKSNANIVFMCAEKNPIECHRAILVARAFHDRGHKVLHIRPDDTMLSQADLERELLDKFFSDRDQISFEKLDKPEKSDEEYIADAYRCQNDEIGYKWEDLTA
jgi:uncharacterized protein (DUF488 family)